MNVSISRILGCASAFCLISIAWGGKAIAGTVVGWGLNGAPPVVTNAVAIGAGPASISKFAILDDGTLFQWGFLSSPTGLSNLVAVSSGQDFGLALKGDGTAVAWGGNGNGQATIPSSLSNNVVAIAAGGQAFGVALRNDGIVAAWGFDGFFGQATVPSDLSNVVAISAGWSFGLALKKDGTVVEWGQDPYLGMQDPPTGLSNVIAISSGYDFNVALKSDGTVVQWGRTHGNIPVGLSNVVAISAAAFTGYALKSDGTVVGWGSNVQGETNIPVGLSNVVAIAGGDRCVLALQNEGSPYLENQPKSQTLYSGTTFSFNERVVSGTPYSCQWLLNGTNLVDATNTTLTVLNPQPADAGTYSVVLTNVFGRTTSSNAVMAVVVSPPIITRQLADSIATLGNDTTLELGIAGSLPMTFQWSINGTNIDGGTNASLKLPNIQYTNQGIYRVVISNGLGAVTSSNSVVTVLAFGTALNETNMVWSSSGGAPWFVETNVAFDGVAAAQSGLIGNDAHSTLQANVTGPGRLTFSWMFAPTNGSPPNHLSFSVNGGNGPGAINDGIGSIPGWHQNTYYVGSGPQIFQWQYSRSTLSEDRPLQSTGWVDQVIFVPGGTPPFVTTPPTDKTVPMGSNVTMRFFASGTPPFTYQWQLNGNALPAATKSFLTLTNAQPTNSGNYTVVISNAFGSVTTNATLVVQPFAVGTGSAGASIAANGFQLRMDGIFSTNPVIILASTNLVNWSPIFTNPATAGSTQFLDLFATNLPFRFYRAKE